MRSSDPAVITGPNEVENKIEENELLDQMSENKDVNPFFLLAKGNTRVDSQVGKDHCFISRFKTEAATTKLVLVF